VYDSNISEIVETRIIPTIARLYQEDSISHIFTFSLLDQRHGLEFANLYAMEGRLNAFQTKSVI
jgi:hypothetical protein